MKKLALLLACFSLNAYAITDEQALDMFIEGGITANPIEETYSSNILMFNAPNLNLCSTTLSSTISMINIILKKDIHDMKAYRTNAYEILSQNKSTLALACFPPK